MGSRTWIKIYCERWLNGTIREETPELRGIWIDLLVLAGSGKYGDSGEIKITDQVGFLDQQLADLLQISRQKWATIKEKLNKTDRVIIKNGNIIAIKNWSKYQSEYERQRGYRHSQGTTTESLENCNQKLQQEVTTKSTTGERDKRIEKENIEREGVINIDNKESVLDIYRDLIGEPSEDLENEIELAIKDCTAPWVIDAIREGVKRDRKDWPYIGGILKNWLKNQQLYGNRYGKVSGNRTRSQDPDKYVKGTYGHMTHR